MKVLKWLGWLGLPYIMILFQWRKLGKPGRAIGVIWSVFALMIACTNNESTQQLSTESQNKNATTEVKTESKPTTPTKQVQVSPISANQPQTVKPVESKKEESKSATTEVPNKKLIPAKVERVVDGDTMEVSFNGKTETVRLLLVDTPETKHPDKPVQPFGPEASAFAKETLTGKDVKIEIDVSERDKYGRLLAYLWVGDRMFNEMLLEKGLARVAYVIPPNVKYVDQFRGIEKKAQQAGIGIWSIENYAQENGFHEELVKQKSPQQQLAKPQPAKQTPKASTPSNSKPEWARAEAAIKSGGDCDCGDFDTQVAAQSFFESHNPQADPYGLDGPKGSKSSGKPGVACESLP